MEQKLLSSIWVGDSNLKIVYNGLHIENKFNVIKQYSEIYCHGWLLKVKCVFLS